MMKKLFWFTISVLMALTIIRGLIGVDEPMTLTRFLNVLSKADISFENTLEQIAKLRSGLVFPDLGDMSLLNSISGFFTWLYTFFKNLLLIPIEIIHDLLNFLASILEVFQALLT